MQLAATVLTCQIDCNENEKGMVEEERVEQRMNGQQGQGEDECSTSQWTAYFAKYI